MKKTISLALVFALALTKQVAKADFIFGKPTNLGNVITNAGGSNQRPRNE